MIKRKVLFQIRLLMLFWNVCSSVKLDPAPQQVCIFCICFVYVLVLTRFDLASIPMLFDSYVICFIFCFSVYDLLPTLMINSSLYYWNTSRKVKLCVQVRSWKLFLGVNGQSCSCVDGSSSRIPCELGIFWAVSNIGLTVNIVGSKIIETWLTLFSF